VVGVQAEHGAGARTRTALVVEGVAEWRDTTRAMLERHGYKVLMSVDGDQALAVSRTFDDHIDLLLTDVVMPTMQGPELADAIRADRPSLAVIYKTAYARHTLAELGIRPVMLLEKPVDETELIDTLARVLPDAPGRTSRYAC
jgi:two-component system, cell cycle sensor histidine kinase and response regulator CckA